MEHIDFININRLKWCLDDTSISLDELARECGVSNSTLERLMAGEDGLTFNQLKKVSDYFGRGVFFFLQEGDLPDTGVHSVQYRTLTSQKPDLSMSLRKLIERVERQRDRYLALLEEVELEHSAFKPPSITGGFSEKASEIREWLGLHTENDFTSFRQAVESRGILVFRSNGYQGKWQIPKNSPILGFSLYHEICPAIVVKKLQIKERQTFTLFHELAHLLLHGESAIDDESDLVSDQGLEREANKLAGHILVPDSFLDQIDISQKPDDADEYAEWLRPFKQLWGVSAEVILRRLLDRDSLSHLEYKAYRDWLSTQKPTDESGGRRLYRYREPVQIFGRRFVKTVFDALRDIWGQSKNSWIPGANISIFTLTPIAFTLTPIAAGQSGRSRH